MKRKTKVAVIGIGRVGLPLALMLAEDDFFVYGLDIDQKKITQLKEGVMPFIEKGAGKLLKKHVNKNFRPTIDNSVVSDCQYIIMTLGTPVDENMNPVYKQIDDALKAIMPFFQPQQTLILRSTVSPGTTDYVKLLINDSKNLKVGKNFYVSFCPERIAEGRALEELKTIPQIVGGVDKKSARKADAFFKKFGVKTLVTDAVSAELAKLFTNMYRYINFAIANEFMIISANYHRDIYEIVNLVNKDYKRGGLMVPGLTSGPCLFKDGFFLIADFPFNDLIATSWKINEAIPLFLIKKIRERMRLDGKKAAILGLAFKPEIDDPRESLSFKVRKALLRERAQVVLHDPYVTDYQNQEIEKDVYQAIKGASLLFFATRHCFYQKLDLEKLKKLVRKNCLVCDVWNLFNTNKIVFTISQL